MLGNFKFAVKSIATVFKNNKSFFKALIYTIIFYNDNEDTERRVWISKKNHPRDFQ